LGHTSSAGRAASFDISIVMGRFGYKRTVGRSSSKCISRYGSEVRDLLEPDGEPFRMAIPSPNWMRMRVQSPFQLVYWLVGRLVLFRASYPIAFRAVLSLQRGVILRVKNYGRKYPGLYLNRLFHVSRSQAMKSPVTLAKQRIRSLLDGTALLDSIDNYRFPAQKPFHRFEGSVISKNRFGKSRPTQILFGNFRYWQRPFNAKRWIIVANAAGKSWFIGCRDQVAHFNVIAESLKAVCEASWNVKLVAVRRRELKLLPTTKGR
jgi:hypothetical protein